MPKPPSCEIKSPGKPKIESVELKIKPPPTASGKGVPAPQISGATSEEK
jgi:hypothetical protein